LKTTLISGTLTRQICNEHEAAAVILDDEQAEHVGTPV